MRTEDMKKTFANWKYMIWSLLLCLVIATTAVAAEEIVPLEDTDAMSIIMGEGIDGPFRPLRRIGAATIWEGPVSVVDNTLSCAGITAEIIPPDQESDYPETRYIGIGGAEVTLEEMDLSAVHVNMAMTDDGFYVVRFIVQGPALILRGRITDIDTELETVTVQGFTISVLETTRLRKLRLWHYCKPIRFSDLKIGAPVRVVANYTEDAYQAIGVLAVLPPWRNYEKE